MMNLKCLQLSHLSIGYREGKSTPTAVLEDINATLHAGEMTCLLGANGIGKSTLLRTLSGFQPPIAGTIMLHRNDGEQITELQDMSHAEMARTVSVVLTGKTDVQNLTVEELVSLGRSPYTGFWGNLKAKDKEVVGHAIEQVGIRHLQGRMVQTLSDGERQKVMIAKALAQQTPVILLDEPTAFLDFPSKVEMLQLLHRLAHDTGKLILLSTHDLELALQLADCLWIFQKGKTMRTGTPQELTDNGILKDFIENGNVRFERGRIRFNTL